MKINNEKGVILIWFFLMITILMILSGAIFTASFQESRLIQIDKFRDRAFYLAEAGLDKKLQELRGSNISNISSTSFSNGIYSVTYDGTTKLITSTGTYNGVTRIIKAKVNKTTPPGARGAMTAADDVSLLSGPWVRTRSPPN